MDNASKKKDDRRYLKMSPIYNYNYLQLKMSFSAQVKARSGLDSVCFAPLASVYNEIPTQYGVKIYIVYCPRNIQRHFKYRVCV